MDKTRVESSVIADELFVRYPSLDSCRESITDAHKMLLRSYEGGGKLLLAGNGGSAADSDHISGELNKSFRFKRPVDDYLASELERLYGEDGRSLTASLEGGLPAIPLTLFNASNSAFNNDVSSESAYAQLVQVLGNKGDVFIGITTSGNSGNIVKAIMAAKARGLSTIALTGETGGKCKGLADICICVPEKDTFKVQELHLPVYHALCAMVESDMFRLP